MTNDKLLIMITDNGFYLIEAMVGIPLEQQAKDHAELNSHIIRVEDVAAKVLWKKIIN